MDLSDRSGDGCCTYPPRTHSSDEGPYWDEHCSLSSTTCQEQDGERCEKCGFILQWQSPYHLPLLLALFGNLATRWRHSIFTETLPFYTPDEWCCPRQYNHQYNHQYFSVKTTSTCMGGAHLQCISCSMSASWKFGASCIGYRMWGRWWMWLHSCLSDTQSPYHALPPVTQKSNQLAYNHNHHHHHHCQQCYNHNHHHCQQHNCDENVTQIRRATNPHPELHHNHNHHHCQRQNIWEKIKMQPKRSFHLWSQKEKHCSTWNLKSKDNT